jgi:hypothetical protein
MEKAKSTAETPVRSSRANPRAMPLAAELSSSEWSLQNTIGNHQLARLVSGHRLRPARRSSNAHDRSEEEADRIAEGAIARPPGPASERTLPQHDDASGTLLPQGHRFNDAAHAFFRPRFGPLVDGVRLHTDDRAAASARALSADAYTVGSDIVFGAGRYAPDTGAGRKLIAHELGHVVQQRVKMDPPSVQRQADPAAGSQLLDPAGVGQPAMEVPPALPADVNIGFNPMDIVHRLLIAIDQSQVKFPQVKRHVDFAAVVSALNDLTVVQAKSVEEAYGAHEKPRTLRQDLFEKGESGFDSDLTKDQRFRIQALLGGTSASGPDDVEALTNRRKADAAELHSLLHGSRKEADVERIMTILRRDPSENSDLAAVYAQLYSVELSLDLAKLRPDALLRASMLRAGSPVAADAFKVDLERARIVEIDRRLAGLRREPFAWVEVDNLKKERKRLVESIERRAQQAAEEGRKEAIAQGEGATAADVAARTRVVAVLGDVEEVAAAVRGADADVIRALAADDPVARAASQIRKSSAAGTLKASHITAALRGLRDDARARAQAEADAKLEADAIAGREASPATEDEIAARADALAEEYFSRLPDTYDAIAVVAFTEVVQITGNKTEVELNQQLLSRRGRLDDVTELELALRGGRKDLETAKRVLADKSGPQIAQLKSDYYERSGRTRTLDHDMFGDAPTTSGGENPELMGTFLKKQGKATGTDRLILEDYMQRPQQEGAVEEVLYLVARAEREYEYAIANRGLTGAWRDAWGNEERTLLNESIAVVRESAIRYLGLVGWSSGTVSKPEQIHSEKAHQLLLQLRLARATIRGDRAAYEKATAELRATFEAVASFVIQAALSAVLGPLAAVIGRLGKAALVARRFAQWGGKVVTGAASSIGANAMVYGNGYSVAMLKRDLLGGLGGAAGVSAVAKLEKLAGRLLGPVGKGIAARLGPKCPPLLAAGAKNVGVVAGEGAKAVGSIAGQNVAQGESLTDNLTLESIMEEILLDKASEGLTGKISEGIGLAPEPAPAPGPPPPGESAPPAPGESAPPAPVPEPVAAPAPAPPAAVPPEGAGSLPLPPPPPSLAIPGPATPTPAPEPAEPTAAATPPEPVPVTPSVTEPTTVPPKVPPTPPGPGGAEPPASPFMDPATGIEMLMSLRGFEAGLPVSMHAEARAEVAAVDERFGPEPDGPRIKELEATNKQLEKTIKEARKEARKEAKEARKRAKEVGKRAKEPPTEEPTKRAEDPSAEDLESLKRRQAEVEEELRARKRRRALQNKLAVAEPGGEGRTTRAERTYSIIEIADRNGNLIARIPAPNRPVRKTDAAEIKERVKEEGGGVHSEEGIVIALREWIAKDPANRARLLGGSMRVTVDQEVCGEHCQPALRALAEDLKLTDVTAVTVGEVKPEASGKAELGPGDIGKAKTVATTMTHPEEAVPLERLAVREERIYSATPEEQGKVNVRMLPPRSPAAMTMEPSGPPASPQQVASPAVPGVGEAHAPVVQSEPGAGAPPVSPPGGTAPAPPSARAALVDQLVRMAQKDLQPEDLGYGKRDLEEFQRNAEHDPDRAAADLKRRLDSYDVRTEKTGGLAEDEPLSVRGRVDPESLEGLGERTHERFGWETTEEELSLIQAEFPQLPAEHWRTQRPVRQGQVVERGVGGRVRKGDTIPELYHPGTDTAPAVSLEAKNYLLDDAAVREDPFLMSDFLMRTSAQARHRATQLPPGAQQIILIDIRGQHVSAASRQAIRRKLAAMSAGALTPENIRFVD